MRISDLKRTLERLGYTVEPGTKHWKVTGPNGRAYPIPAHNGARSEVGKAYIRGLCRLFDLAESDLHD